MLAAAGKFVHLGDLRLIRLYWETLNILLFAPDEGLARDQVVYLRKDLDVYGFGRSNAGPIRVRQASLGTNMVYVS